MAKKTLIACALSMSLALSVPPGSPRAAGDRYQREPTAEEMFADAVIVRPLTLVASGVGLAAWVVTLPFSIPSGSAGDAGKAWVLDPLEYTFMRPLGEMGTER